MQPSKVIVRSPYVCRVVKAPVGVRPMSLFSATQHLPRFPSTVFPGFSHEITPLLRLMDDFATSSRSLDIWSQLPSRQTVFFQPRFDVREMGDSYELRGEVPGVNSSALEVEFTDSQTLIVRGRIEAEDVSNGTNAQPKPATVTAAEASESNTSENKSDAASTHSSSSYQKATVEDEEAVEGSTSALTEPTAGEFVADRTQQISSKSTVEAATTSAPQANGESFAGQSRYWPSERATGSFQRNFTFPFRINQDGVKASLRNGVLNITIPKAAAQMTRRINVE